MSNDRKVQDAPGAKFTGAPARAFAETRRKTTKEETQGATPKRGSPETQGETQGETQSGDLPFGPPMESPQAGPDDGVLGLRRLLLASANEAGGTHKTTIMIALADYLMRIGVHVDAVAIDYKKHICETLPSIARTIHTAGPNEISADEHAASTRLGPFFDAAIDLRRGCALVGDIGANGALAVAQGAANIGLSLLRSTQSIETILIAPVTNKPGAVAGAVRASSLLATQLPNARIVPAICGVHDEDLEAAHNTLLEQLDPEARALYEHHFAPLVLSGGGFVHPHLGPKTIEFLEGKHMTAAAAAAATEDEARAWFPREGTRGLAIKGACSFYSENLDTAFARLLGN